METVTQWFDENPVHVGVYESTPCSDGEYADRAARWDGRKWRWVGSGALCVIQRRVWRGLAEKPKSA